MKKYNSRTIDEIGRLILPLTLRDELRLGPDEKITLLPINSIVLLFCRNDKNAVAQRVTMVQGVSAAIDEIGRITLPDELIYTMGWEKEDSIEFYQADDNTAVLKRERKNMYSDFGMLGRPYP